MKVYMKTAYTSHTIISIAHVDFRDIYPDSQGITVSGTGRSLEIDVLLEDEVAWYVVCFLARFQV